MEGPLPKSHFLSRKAGPHKDAGRPEAFAQFGA
jgi:hypothetical protein